MPGKGSDVPRAVFGPADARLVSCRAGSSLSRLVGTPGVLAVSESERRYPGMYFATFHYNEDRSPLSVSDRGYHTASTVRTGCCGGLAVDGCSVALADAGGSAHYVFETADRVPLTENRF